jgi:TolB-like protein/DNA-binding winged helix-turn-helix (wHTH) protein/tetratricopeptide (TPR) repeat protein
LEHPLPRIVRFEDYQADLQTGELRKNGMKIRLSGQPFQILALLLEKPGELITREELRAKLWPDEVFVDFDHSLNAAVNKLREALCDSTNDVHFIETLPKRGYRFIGPITDGNKDGFSAPPASPSPGARSSSWGIRAPVLAGGLAIVVLLTWLAMHRATRASYADTQGRLVIAVVPLENLSGDPGQDFFVNGLTEEVITQLGQLNPERIGVVKYGSSASTRQAGAMLPDLHKQPGLQFLLEGSVRRQDERARISIRLLRVVDETTVWTESFDRNVGDVLSLQSEIAGHIGRELRIRVLARGNRKPVEPAVIESYFSGRFELAGHVLPVPDAARAHLQHAIELDPSYAPAYAGLADFYASSAVGNDKGAEQAWQLAEKYAIHALTLDSESAETHAAIAQIKLMHNWDWQAAREHALRALQLNPSLPEAHAVYARYLRTAGNVEEALNQLNLAVALDPFRTDLRDHLLFERYFVRDYQSIVASTRQTLANDPNDPSAHDALCINLGRLGLFDESVAECGKFLALDGHSDWAAEYVREYRKRGYEAASLLVARKRLNKILKQPQPDLWDLANAYVLADKREETMRTLFQGLQIHDPGLLQIRVDPDFDSIRNDPRYIELVRQIGFPSE